LWTIAIVQTTAVEHANRCGQALLRLLELLGRYSAGTAEFCELIELG
jgi:hypothetical protein